MVNKGQTEKRGQQPLGMYAADDGAGVDYCNGQIKQDAKHHVDLAFKAEGLVDKENNAQYHRHAGQKEALLAQKTDAEDKQQAADKGDCNMHDGKEHIVPESPAADEPENGRHCHQQNGAVAKKALLINGILYFHIGRGFVFHVIIHLFK
jgi:hypothetical protein